jgi:preprotein translocase subunit SecE
MERVTLLLKNVRQFLVEAKVELKKVTWPAPKQALASTAVVVVVVVIISLFLGLVDFGLTKIIKVFLG